MLRALHHQEEDEYLRLHKTLNTAVEAALKRVRTKLQNMQKQAAEGERAVATKKRADLIVSALHCIEAGATSVQVWALLFCFGEVPHLDGQVQS